MKKYAKKILGWLGLLEYVQYVRLKRQSLKIPTNYTILIHIGKCGGRTLQKGIVNATRNGEVFVIHITKPNYRPDLKYIIVARNPIARLKSAFRWRFKLVVTDGVQKNRFKGEYEVLVKYKMLNKLAEALYFDDGSPNLNAHREIRKIHHIHEDISFYLEELLTKCHPNQIIAVLMQENLNNDIWRVFGYKNDIHLHRKPVVTEEEDQLSDRAMKNLLRFFWKDYKALVKLYCWGKIDREIFLKAILPQV
jgi:hypothetical protein